MCHKPNLEFQDHRITRIDEYVRQILGIEQHLMCCQIQTGMNCVIEGVEGVCPHPDVMNVVDAFRYQKALLDL